MGYLEISLLLLLFPSLLHCKQYTLNVPRVLLPYVPASGVKSNFTLKSEHGCFSWKSTKPDVATVDPVYITTRNGLKCSREAVLTPQSTTSTRLSTVIVATEEATSLILRSDVYVDTINRIEITTRTRELLLEEEPEKFEVRAFDSEGNMFSTVRGHVFEWTLLRDDEAVHQQLEPDAILTFVEFQDSAYSTDPIIGQLEDMHLQGDEVLVAGVNTGTAKVQVRLVETAWKYVLPYVVKLLVIESLILFPSEDMYIMPFSFIDYHVERKKHGKMEVVMMPSDQYRLELTNVTVCSLDRDRSRATGMVIGDTQIVLHDKNMFNIPQATKPSSDIHVVFPHRIGFSVFPGNNWVLQVNREYTIAVNLFDKNNRNIFVTENVLLESAIPNEHFLIYFSSINGSHYFVKTIKTGTTTLTSSIDKLKHPVTNKLHSLSSVITKSQLVEIVEPVVVLPKVLMLLSDKKSEQVYQHTMKATGGSGKYQWNSDTVDVVGVSRLGVVTSVHPGKAIITVSDVRNSDHFDQALVYVVPPSSVGFVTSPVEVVVGQYLLLPLQVMGLTIDEKPVEVPFYDCRYMQFKLTLTDEAIFNASMSNSDIGLESIPEGACTFVKVFALKPGHTKLTVLYDHGSIHLETSITIASYPSLRPVDPETIAVVTLGSSKTVVFEGGPSAWVLDPSQYDRTLTPERSSDVVITTLPPSTLTQHTIRVTCLVHGIQDLTLSVKNEPTANNPIPASETTTIKISCALPVSMAIKPVVKEMTDCPLLRGTNQDLEFPVHNGAPLQLEVTVFDRERRQFDNFSSLQWTWSSSDDTLLSLTLDVINNVQHFGHKAILSVGLSQRSGSVTITTSSNSHVTKILEQERIDFKDPFSPKVNYSLSLLLKSAVSVSPEELLVYNHPKNMATLTVLHGSRHFRVDHIIKPRPPVADVEYIKESQSINIHPLGEGQIRITIRDLCLPVPDVTVMVYVATIHSIQVKVPDKVQVGNSIFAYVRLLDNRAKPFPSDQHHLMKLQSNPKTEHIEIKPATNGDVSRLPASETSISLVYVVEGVTMGMALLLYNATVTTGKVITSWPAEIQVFDALRLTPKNITLIPTATFQIRSFGGPVHQTSIIYAIDNITVATVDQSGLITATVPGNAIVTGKAQSQDSTNPSGMTTPTNLIYSSDTVVVKVVKLTGIKIVVPSKKLVAGEEIAVYVEGENESETPFSFASGIPSLTFHWSVSNMDVLSLVSVYDQAGVSLQEERDFPTLLRTRNPGQGVIQVSMKCPPGFCIPDEGTFNDQVDIRVFSLLKLINPSDGHLLLPQNGNTRIRTNRDGSSHISYSLIQPCSQEEQPVISLGPNGEIHTAGFNGHAVVMVTADELDLGVNQTVLVHCEVGVISSLSLSPVSPAKATPHSKHHAFPLGYSALFSVNLHDSIGRQFDYADIDLSYRLNRFDIVHVTKGEGNESFVVKAAKQGNAVFKVWVTDQPTIDDYVRVRVGYAIIPSLATVHLGAKICFTTHLTEQNQPGRWSISEGSILSINEDTGVATATATGRTVVYHKIGGVVDTLTEISVATLKRVVFAVPSNSPLSIFTNAPVQDERGPYRIHIEFKDEHNDTDFTKLLSSPNEDCLNDGSVLGSSQFIQQVHFQCIVELSDGSNPLNAMKFILAKSVFDPLEGDSHCQLIASDDCLAAETLSTLQGLRLTLKVKASDFKETYSVLSNVLDVPFVPAFSVDTTRVLLSPTEPSIQVKVSGLLKVLNSIQPSSPYPITIAQYSLVGTTATYLVSLTDVQTPPLQNFTDTRVSLSSTLTNQKLVILVSYTGVVDPPDLIQCPTASDEEGGTNKPIETSYLNEEQWNLVFAGVACFILLLATFVVVLALRQSSQRPPDGFTSKLPPSSQPQSPAFSPSTPTRSQIGTPLWSNPGNQSAFKRTGRSAHQTPSTRTSPQHNLFSQ